jgi:hypothetical protein
MDVLDLTYYVIGYLLVLLELSTEDDADPEIWFMHTFDPAGKPLVHAYIDQKNTLS